MGSLYLTSLPQTQWKQISERWQEKGGWWWMGLDQPSLWIQINPAGTEDMAPHNHSTWESQCQHSGGARSSSVACSQTFRPHLLHLAWMMLHSLQDNPSCNEDCQNHNSTGWKYPSTAGKAFFFSFLCFSVAFHHALFPTISLVWQHDVLVCQLFLTLWQTNHSW